MDKFECLTCKSRPQNCDRKIINKNEEFTYVINCHFCKPEPDLQDLEQFRNLSKESKMIASLIDKVNTSNKMILNIENKKMIIERNNKLSDLHNRYMSGEFNGHFGQRDYEEERERIINLYG